MRFATLQGLGRNGPAIIPANDGKIVYHRSTYYSRILRTNKRLAHTALCLRIIGIGVGVPSAVADTWLGDILFSPPTRLSVVL
ncbi:hypothetical protein BCR34DRAFT_563274 [Clohesyomyces aquaticus]|uniref:Uncharacterized protein n=1 Tax=Clohesyomyces aquaticus TaxID=1231657 RepID=A0A1Y1ZR68_9PLEO|nr:hypothetical protein BCR34DRAFT_563274 [Clohesyomyces aquaticus]